MNLKELSNEELLDDLLSDHVDLLIDNYLSPIKRNLIKGNFDNEKTELLSRLDKGEKAIGQLSRIDKLVNDFCPDCREVKHLIGED